MWPFSVDPGSAHKGWAIADCTFGDGPDVRTRRMPIAGLKALVEDVCGAAHENHVLLSLDAPVRVFGGLQAPSSFEPAGTAEGGRGWPFNVNPLSQRPCDHALSSRPTVVNGSLVALELAEVVAEDPARESSVLPAWYETTCPFVDCQGSADARVQDRVPPRAPRRVAFVPIQDVLRHAETEGDHGWTGTFRDKYALQCDNDGGRMDYFQGVVADYLSADRGMFVKPECCIQLGPEEAPQAGRHWYCDVLAVCLREPRSVYLCEVSYSKSLDALFQRLEGWSANWPEVCEALAEHSGLDASWPVRPWLFVLRAQRDRVSRRLPRILALGAESPPMPNPLVTSLEDVGPWLYGSPHRLPGLKEAEA